MVNVNGKIIDNYWRAKYNVSVEALPYSFFDILI